MGREEAAPAHADGGEDGNGIPVQDAGGVEGGQQAQGRSHGAQGGHGEGDELHMGEAEEPFEDPVDFFGQPGQDGNALGRGTVVHASGTGAEGNHDHGRGNDEHARNNLQSQFHTVFTAVQHRIQEAHEDAVLVMFFGLFLWLVLNHFFQHRAVHFGIGLEAAALHDAGTDDGAAEGAEQTHHGAGDLPVANHGDDDHEAHTEGGTEVGEGNELVFLEIGREVTVLGQGDDGRVVAQESHDAAQGCHAGQVIQGFHEGTQHAFQQFYHTEFRHQFGQGAREDGDAHEVEYGIQQQVVGRVHHGLEHIAAAHLFS